jgi:hypothetical protein
MRMKKEEDMLAARTSCPQTIEEAEPGLWACKKVWQVAKKSAQCYTQQILIYFDGRRCALILPS